MKTRRSLRSDIIIINFIVFAIILFMQFFYFAYLSGLMEDQKRRDVDGLISQVNNKIEDCINTSKAMRHFITNDTEVRDFLVSKDAAEKQVLWEKFSQEVRDESSIYIDSLCVIIQDMDGKYYYALNEPTEVQKKEIDKLLSQTVYGNSSESTGFFDINDSPYKNIYTCLSSPIVKHNTKIVGTETVGRVIVINKFNARELAYENGFFNGIRIELIPAANLDTVKADIEFEAGNKSVSSELSIYTTPWKIKAEVDSQVLKDDFGLNQQMAVVVIEIIIIALAVLVMVFILNRSIARPAENILKFLNDYRLNGGGQRLDRFDVAEFDSISLHINMMLSKNEEMARNIVRNQQKLYEKEISEKEAMLYALQSQINPHFLYNTLDCMSSIAITNEQDDIYKIAMGLAEILRYSLVDGIDVCLEDEIAVVEKYLAIQQIRFRGKVEVDIDIDDDVWEVGMLRMSLQPIVENIFKYGMKDNNTRITIKGYREDNNVFISVKDNGNGMSDIEYNKLIDRLSGEPKLYSKKGKNGLVNINKRLKFRYGSNYGITINQKHNQFMEVVVKIPFEEEEG